MIEKRNISKMRWSEAVTLEFVQIYLKHECLWNPEHPNYKLKREREKAYSEIRAEFLGSTSKNVSIPEVKVKIKNLRTTYLQQVNKILQRSSPDCIYEPSLIWFHDMDRCLKHIPINRHSSSYNTLPPQQTSEVDSSCQIWVDQEAQNDNEEETNPDPLISQNDMYYSSQEESNVKREASPIYRKTKKRKYKNKNPVYYIQDSNSDAGTSSREDEFDIYGKHIASQLRQMDLHKALKLQLEIQSLVSKTRMSDE